MLFFPAALQRMGIDSASFLNTNYINVLLPSQLQLSHIQTRHWHIEQGITSPSLKFGFNLVFHKCTGLTGETPCRQNNMVLLHTGPALTTSTSDPSTIIVISHCPSPKIPSPFWIIQKRQFWEWASGNAPCSITHLLVSSQNGHSIGPAYGNAHFAFQSSPNIPSCSPSSPSPFLHLLFIYTWHWIAYRKAVSLTGKPCCPGFPLSPSSPSWPWNKEQRRKRVCSWVLLWQ